jgi:hypothetical protein
MSGTPGCTDDARTLWPRLSCLPSTNALLALVGTLWFLTGACALAHWNPADRWYQGLETFTGIVMVQFIGKRWTNGRGVNGNGSSSDLAKP